jgi:hypothetical protein
VKRLNFIPLFIISILIISSSCNDDSPNPGVIQLLINSSVEAGNQKPNKWYVGPEGTYQTSWTDEHSFTGEKSLLISSDNDVGEFSYWYQSVGKDIPYGRRLRLSSMIKLDNVDPNSDGVAIAVRGDDQDRQRVYFYTTQGDIPIRGDQDWTKFSVDMKSNIQEEATRLWVFLILGNNTEGRVYFDDITLKTIN